MSRSRKSGAAEAVRAFTGDFAGRERADAVDPGYFQQIPQGTLKIRGVRSANDQTHDRDQTRLTPDAPQSGLEIACASNVGRRLLSRDRRQCPGSAKTVRSSIIQGPRHRLQPNCAGTAVLSALQATDRRHTGLSRSRCSFYLNCSRCERPIGWKRSYTLDNRLIMAARASFGSAINA
jgi:hypothetical protein